jgi:hypothetical protein
MSEVVEPNSWKPDLPSDPLHSVGKRVWFHRSPIPAFHHQVELLPISPEEQTSFSLVLTGPAQNRDGEVWQ